MLVAERARPRHDDVDLGRPRIAEGCPVVAPLVAVEHWVLGPQGLGRCCNVVDKYDEVEILGLEARERGAAGQEHLASREELAEAPFVLDHASAFVNVTNAS